MSEPLARNDPFTLPADWPTVSVIMPVRNEEQHLQAAVASILEQQYPSPFDVCLAIAPSTDRTADVARAIAAEYPRVRLVDNAAAVTPAGLNAAIGSTAGEVVVRVDGHAVLAPGYIERAVQTLQRTGAVNVGGIQRAEGVTPFQRAVARAMTSRFGVGEGRVHLGGHEGAADTVYLGVYRRSALEAIGCYDESLRANEDYELNIRLREAGGTVWFDPELWATYRPRADVRSLARQYFQYGRFKRAVVRRYPSSLRVRQAVPPLATIGVIGGLVAGLAWAPALVLPGTYAAAVAVAALASAGRPDGTAARLLVIFPTMHLSWGLGFLVGRAP